MPINPADYYLLRIYWRDKYFYDKCMPMGASSSCKTFEALSTALEWIAWEKLGISHILHILDDFLIIDKNATLWEEKLQAFLNMCSDLGVPMAPEKTLGPSSTLSFAGIELDTCLAQARLPQEKLDKCLSLVD